MKNTIDKDALTKDLKVLAEQEQQLQFLNFNADTAWELGSLLRQRLLERQAGATAEIELAGHVLFTATTPGATPGQADWIRRKRNTVRRFARSSYAVGRQLELDGQTLEERHGLALADFAAHGGGFPLLLKGTGMVGTIIVSGLPQRDDHNVAVGAIAKLLGLRAPKLPEA